MIYVIAYLILGLPISIFTYLRGNYRANPIFILIIWASWPIFTAAIVWQGVFYLSHRGKCAWCGEVVEKDKVKEHILICEAHPMGIENRALRDELEVFTRWIPVSERMPEPGESVSMWIHPHSYVPGNEKLGSYMPMISPLAPWRSTWDMVCYSPEDVTHWRPLPPAPDDDRNQKGE